MTSPPKIADAPGLVWVLRKSGWQANWRARKDLVARGYRPKNSPLWKADSPEEVPTEEGAAYIRSMCERMQSEMLIWGRGGLPVMATDFDGTLGSLIDCYQSDPDSTYHKLRHESRVAQDGLCRRIKRAHGEATLADLGARTFLAWHRDAKGDGNHVSAAHHFIAALRTILGFGATLLEERECQRLRGLLSEMKFELPQSRTEQMTVAYVEAVRAGAHLVGAHSIALSQAIAFECTLRQKDVIGEWVPRTEPGISEVYDAQEKWLRGVQWQEIDDDFVLRHVTSKKQKPIECNLRLAPMVMQEFARLAGVQSHALVRADLPATGPIVRCERTGLPYLANNFRTSWRAIATASGIPKAVWNMDTRAGAISEATEAGAPIEHVKHAAAHSNIAMTEKYSRSRVKKVAGVMQMRVASRNGNGTQPILDIVRTDDARTGTDDAPER